MIEVDTFSLISHLSFTLAFLLLQQKHNPAVGKNTKILFCISDFFSIHA
ncbi:uncharacterized protein METZ01_LOCUS333555, partial [marine metagenome]